MRTLPPRLLLATGLLACLCTSATAQAPATEPAPSGYDAALAQRLGADARGMRKYILVLLKTGPTRVPDGPERDAMFAGHFANMARWSEAGQLVLAGPFMADAAGWRGLYVFAVDGIDAARALTDTDPVIVNGEMVAEYREWYGTAALGLIPDWHERIVPPAAASD
ncbi:YciI family protein [Chiayiivirga flava]|uniref:Uncharacterized protein YciI n=1 Tax=Chiayiivirga flava TaxID=659595 RepID=A0A7W8D545_9GAMM|nr:YciI family protein [Chiayiivirga flava]MBB5206866.1 uncharacterized protein YciI [Chiayiivirga flava]